MSAQDACEVWLHPPPADEAGMLASMIAPLLDRDAGDLETAWRAGPMLAGRDLPMAEATQLADVLMGFGARAEVRMSFGGGLSLPASQPLGVRNTQPFSAMALHDALDAVRAVPEGNARFDSAFRKPPAQNRISAPPKAQSEPPPSRAPEPFSGRRPPRDSLPTPPTPSLPPVGDRALGDRAVGDRARAFDERSTPPVDSMPPPVNTGPRLDPGLRADPELRAPMRTLVDAPPVPVLFSNEPTQVVPVDDDLIREAISAAEAVERQEATSQARISAGELPSGVRRPMRTPVQSVPAGRTPARGLVAPGSEPKGAPAPPAPPALPAASVPARPGGPQETPPPRTTGASAVVAGPPAGARSEADQASLRGRVALPKSMQSRDNQPPWFPKMSIHPETVQRPSPWPVRIFVAGLLALAAAAIFVFVSR